MTKESHLIIGREIARHYLPFLSMVERDAFLYGSVEPDINILTYLRGSRHGEKLRGHSYENMVERTQLILEKLADTENSILFCYRLGKLSHYLVDMFTFPHNAEFKGTLIDHIIYEQKLVRRLPARLMEISYPIFTAFDNDILTYVQDIHDRYLLERNDADDDIDSAVSIVAAVITALYPYPAAAYPEVQYENTVGF